MIRYTMAYTAGVFAGFGFGLITGTYFNLGWHAAVVLPGLTLVVVSAFLARYAKWEQPHHTLNNENNDEEYFGPVDDTVERLPPIGRQ
jgi:hypothetical protein